MFQEMTLISNDHCCFYYLEKPNYTWLPQVHFEMLLLVCEYKSLGNTLSLGRGGGVLGAVSLPPDVADLMTVVPNLGCTISITLIPRSGPQGF